MKTEIEKLHALWHGHQPRALSPNINIIFDDLANSLTCSGPFYYYVIDFFDCSLSHISDSLCEIQGFEKKRLCLDHILQTIHPEDLPFVAKAEKFLINYFEDIRQLLHYKASYCFRMLLANGEYGLFQHQALMLTMNENGSFGKSLNIHTQIDHLTNHSLQTISLVGLNGHPSILNLPIPTHKNHFSKREMQIINLLADGLTNCMIAEKLFISPLTVKKHRNNILEKSNCRNTAELIAFCNKTGIL